MSKRYAAVGRPEIPDRAAKAISTRLRNPVDKVVRQAADEMDIAYGEYVSFLVAQALGMPEHAPTLPSTAHQQEELFNKSA